MSSGTARVVRDGLLFAHMLYVNGCSFIHTVDVDKHKKHHERLLLKLLL